MDLPEPLRTALQHRGDAPVEELLDLLAVDTSNPPGETATLVDAVEARFDRLGVATERVVADPAKPNLLARIPGDGSRTLLYNGHLDTVPYDGRAWEHDPLGERDGDRVYGRGATDMKGPLAAMLEAAAVYAETETTPPVSLQFALVSDEEVAGEPGLPAVLDAGRLDADWCVIGETTCGGDRRSVTVADRGSVWLTLEAAGSGAHGSRPMLGENAIDRLYGAIEAIRSRFGTEPFDLVPEVRSIVDESVAYYEPTMGEAAARDLFAHPTINLGTLSGGKSVNSVPVSARAELDVRLTAGVRTPEVLARLRDCVADCEGIEIADVSWSVGTYEPLDSPLVAAVTETVADATGDRVYRRSATGGGDAKKFRETGVPTVEFALGTDTAHAADEYTTVDALRGNARIYAALPYHLAEVGDRPAGSA
ncbi:M20 family metallopeptidase (plasmid) [Haloarcula salina]|uniref:M20 family metallopeptidase n=1 Tax=Haloarcula salina TaxID=1429914 RepID=UPI003C6EA926